MSRSTEYIVKLSKIIVWVHDFQFRFINKTWDRLRTIIYLLYLCILCCLSYSACVLIVMFLPSNFNVLVAEILWKFSVWWYFVFCQLHSMVSITSCPLHRNCPVNSVKCYFCFSSSFHEMSVSIVTSLCSLVSFPVVFIY